MMENYAFGTLSKKNLKHLFDVSTDLKSMIFAQYHQYVC